MMDNPQHYQPLSHALHPPLVRSPQYHTYDTSGHEYAANGSRREEEEEEEEEVVEEELDENEPQDASPRSSPENRPRATTGPAASTNNPSEQTTSAQSAVSQSQPAQSQPDPDSPQSKRRPGRPKGSRNRKPRERAGSASKPQHGFHNYPPPPSGAPNLPGVTPQNQQYYEFQWRILNLCSEFYGAAEELVKATPPTVIAQSYQMGPSNKLDPLNMLNDAKRICDQLLQNPSQLVGQTPPAVYPSMSYAQPQSATPAPSPASTSTQPTQVITNPQSFVMPLGSHPGAPMSAMPYAMYATPSRYAPGYYPYPGYYSPAPQPGPQSSSAPPGYATPTTNTSTIVNTTGAVSASGTWTDEEVERLKKLAEQNRSSGSSSEIDWDAVVGQWGNTRTRHQILLKATNLGLKESSTRGTKRRREADASAASEERTSAPNPAASSAAATAGAGATASPAQSHATASTPSTQPSPATNHPTAQPAPASTGSAHPAPVVASASANIPIPWPMPTVAANTAPVIPTQSQQQQQQQQQQGSSRYYRNDAGRPSVSSSKPASTQGQTSTHHFIYQSNGNARDSRG